MLRTIAMFLLFVWMPIYADSSPFKVKLDMFDNAESYTLGLSVPQGLETFTVFTPNEKTDKFSNGVQIMPFKGKLYAEWQSCPKDEDSNDGTVVYSYSDDGKNWAAPIVVAQRPKEGNLLRSGGGFWATEKELILYIQKTDSWYPGTKKITEIRKSTDGINWSAVEVLFDDVVIAASPMLLTQGEKPRLIMPVHGHLPHSKKLFAQIMYSDNTDGISGWTKAALPATDSKHKCYGIGLEHSWFYTADNKLIAVFRDMNITHKLAASVSGDRGQSWSEIVPTDMPDSYSMQSCGNLPDGTAFMINNPVNNPQRYPLVITLSKDGKVFDKAFLLRGAPPAKIFEGRAKANGYSYPNCVIWQDSLYISYSTNKEVVDITRVPLNSFQNLWN